MKGESSSFETLDLDNRSLSSLVDVLTRIRIRGCDVEHWEFSDSTNGFHVTVSCHCGACRLVFDDSFRYSKDVNRPRYAQNVLFQSRRRKLYLLKGNVSRPEFCEHRVKTPVAGGRDFFECRDCRGIFFLNGNGQLRQVLDPAEIEAGGLTDD